MKKGNINKDSLKRSARVFSYLKPYTGIVAIGLFFLIITSGTALAFPKLMGDMIEASSELTTDSINRIALILLAVFSFQAIASFIRIYTFSYVTEKSLAALRSDVYQRLICMPMSFFSVKKVGELNSRIASDVTLLQETFNTTIAEFIRQLLIIVIGVILLSFTSAKLTLFMLTVVPVIALTAVFFGKFIKNLSKKTQDKIAESNTVIEETFQGIANVKAFANEAFEINRYQSAIQKVIHYALKGARWRGAFASFIILSIFGAIISVVWYGAILVQNPEENLTVGTLVEFILYTVFIGASIGGIAAQYGQIQKAIGATENLMDLLDETPETISFSKEASIQLHGEVTFQDVYFNYPSRMDVQVLNGINFTAKKGESIAIVGSSGSGKSTIASLLLRFYHPQSGTIFIDDKPSTDYALTALRNQMAIVPQDVLLFGGSIRENIAYGKPDASDHEIIAAAQQANAEEFIEKFPDKYDTIVGDRGIQLSGGQRQRIAIARAILKNPTILILDEATSSLDSESEQVVQSALDRLMHGRTSIVIAHRLSTIRKADKIIVLENGQIKESGTHEELHQISDGIYKKLSDIQFELS